MRERKKVTKSFSHNKLNRRFESITLKGSEMTTKATQDPFSRFSQDFPEMYEIVRTVIVVRHRRLYKIEVLKDHTTPTVFKVHYSLEERFEIKPVDSIIPRVQESVG